MNVLIRCVFLYSSFTLVYITCLNENMQSNSSDSQGGGTNQGTGGFDFSQVGELLNSLKENSKGKPGDSGKGGNGLDMLNNFINAKGSSNGGIENLMSLFNNFSNKGNADTKGKNGNAGENNFDIGNLMNIMNQFTTPSKGGNTISTGGSSGSSVNSGHEHNGGENQGNLMEQIGNMIKMMNTNNNGKGSGGNGKASNPLEHLTSLLGNLGGGKKGEGGSDGKGSNPLEHLTSLLGNLGGGKKGDGNSDGKGSNPMEHLTSLLGNLGGGKKGEGGGDGKGSNPLEHLTSLLGNLGGGKKGEGGSDGKGSNPLEHLTSLLGNLGGGKKGEEGSDGKGSNPLEHLASLLGNLGGGKKGEGSGSGGNNNKMLGDLQSLLGNFLNTEKNHNAPFALDKSITDGSSRSKESILQEYSKKDRDILIELQKLINQRKGNSNRGNIDISGQGLSEGNEKLKSFFSALKDKYNPYSYERRILDDLISEGDIKNKYNMDDNFEKLIFVNGERGVEYQEMSDREKEKKTEMFVDINELDDKDTIDSGSINSHILRKNKLENEKLLRGLISGDSDNLHECNCDSSKVKNCIFSYLNYSNLEYMLGSLNIDVKSMVKKHMEDTKKVESSKVDSFLVPLPPLHSKSNVQNTSKYVLRVPRVLFLATKKSFSSSLDRYFFHLYDVMESQLKWNTYMWGYGFKYYPLFFSKNLHTLLHSYDKQIGNEPFDLIFVHNSFVSSYYNHYFFLKNMPKITTLIYINDGWDNNVKSSYVSLFPHIFFQNQVNIFEYNPLNNINTEIEKKKLSNSIWNKVSSSNTNDIITNKHKKKKEVKKNSSSTGEGTDDDVFDVVGGGYDDENNTLWAFLPHGVNPCCYDDVDVCFELEENRHRGELDDSSNSDSSSGSSDSGVGVSPTFYADQARRIGGKREGPILSYSLLDLFAPACNFREPAPTALFSNENRDIDVLYLYNTTSSNYNDFLIQKIMDYVYNKNMHNLKDHIHKYEVDLHYWKVWGLQTTHKLIKNKMKEYNSMLQRSKVCVISSKFAGMLNKMVIDSIFNGCVVITDKSHNKDINKYLVPTRIPYEYYEIPDLIYNNENIHSLSIDMIDIIRKTLKEVNNGTRNKMRIDAFKTVLNTYTYQGIILNWILPTLYFHHNKEKYELMNNYFVLPQYFEKVISKSLKTTSAKREKIIANIDISLQEDLIMNNNEVATWCLIWFIIFTVICFYILKNSNIIGALFKQRKLHL
ncbi:conserved Plasmodium protein, unknown function [Plasmodium ovale]|uniref:Golgi protein 2 n=1 Tax=Plasmodium ovale TaxID=36330 RepID=A0A1D3THY5_PLAOA|nr:conserved Plasmodium protein, unknown function [Plasmodium ovale]